METTNRTAVYPLYIEEVANPGKKMLVGVLAKNGDREKRECIISDVQIRLLYGEMSDDVRRRINSALFLLPDIGRSLSMLKLSFGEPCIVYSPSIEESVQRAIRLLSSETTDAS